MKTRHLAFLLLPVVAIGTASSTLSLTACDNAVTLDGPGTDGGGGGVIDGPSLQDSPTGKDVTVDAPETGPSDMSVDGIPCTKVTATIVTQSAPDGDTWTMDLVGTCGALGVVDAYVASKDNVAYPQSCVASSTVQLSVGGEGDAGFLAYSTQNAGSACSITEGPTLAAQGTSPRLTATVASDTGKTHVLKYRYAIPAGSMTVDGVTCTGVVPSITTKGPPGGNVWALDLAGTCGALGLVDAFIQGLDDASYPQSCTAAASIRVSVGGEGDAGFLAYDGDVAGGSCTVASGPTAAALTTGIRISSVVANGAGKTHTVAYAAINAP